MRRLCLLVSASAALAGCGGRVSEPVLVERAIDGRLTCAHLAAELSNNQKRLAELDKEKSDSQRNNAGLLLVGPLFLDTQDNFKEESAALTARNERLKALMGERGCEDASSAG